MFKFPYLLTCLLALNVGATNLRNQKRLVEYDEEEAYLAISFNGVATCQDHSVILNWNCGICENGVYPAPKPNPLTSIVIVEDDDGVTQMYAGYDALKDRIVVGFQGSKTISQFLLDLDHDLRSVDEYCPECRVHSGFYDGYARVGDEIINTITSISDMHGTNDVLYVGHSLGGALAAHASIQVELAHPDRFHQVVYSFGQPRIGNKAFADFTEDLVPNFFRIINYRDPIPNFFGKSSNGYWFNPQEIWYYKKPNPGEKVEPNSFKVLSGTNGEDPDGQASVCGSFCLNPFHHNSYLNVDDFGDEDLFC